MSFLKPRLLFSLTRSFSKSVASPAAWNKDWKPGPYPLTEEEEIIAAKKYNLLPEEYKPVPDDGEGIGDYPLLEPVSAESRDPFYPWDYPEYRRNFGEVMHRDFNIYTEDRINAQLKPRCNLYTVQIPMFLGVMIFFYAMFWLTEDCCFFPLAEPHLPAPGKKHYSYEKPDSKC